MRTLTAQLLTDHEALIAHIANRFALTMDYDAQELISFGRSVLIKNAHKWHPSRGKFSTFLWWLLRSEFIDYIKKQRRLVLTEVLDECVPSTASALPSATADLLSGTAGDAYAMVNIILQSGWHENLSRLSDRLFTEMTVKRKWTPARYNAAFAEIEQIVRDW